MVSDLLHLGWSYPSMRELWANSILRNANLHLHYHQIQLSSQRRNPSIWIYPKVMLLVFHLMVVVITSMLLTGLTQYSTQYYYQIVYNNNTKPVPPQPVNHSFKTLPDPTAPISIAVYGGTLLNFRFGNRIRNSKKRNLIDCRFGCWRNCGVEYHCWKNLCLCCPGRLQFHCSLRRHGT